LSLLRHIGWIVLAALSLAAPASAVTISNLAVSDTSTSAFDDSGPVGSVAESGASLGASSASGFGLRYGAVVGADTGGAGGGSFTQSFTGSFSIQFEVTEAAGASWMLSVDVVRSGALTIVSDGSGWAEVTLGALSVVHSGAGALAGSLDLAAVGTLGNEAAPGDSPDLAFLQSASTLITGVGTGAPQLVTLSFSFTASASTMDVAGGFVQGDEGALRMGRDGALLSFTADDYPGPGARSLAGDGIGVSVATVPEPGAEILLALGLIGLGWAERTRTRRS
jgi:MYXO-CTERM domain-containing protein